MAYDIYDATIPPLIHMLSGLSTVLAKGEAHGGIDPSEAKLAPDMLPLKAQVYIATDGAKGCGARLAGVEIPNTKTPKPASPTCGRGWPRPSTSSRPSTARLSRARRTRRSC